MRKTAILISNLGTPENYSTKAVRKYLREFLSDPFVVNKPRWLWLPILHFIILNIRPKQSAQKYQKIWMQEGSPLLVHSQNLLNKLKKIFPENPTSLGMRYGNPSLKQAVKELLQQDINEILVLPLYPQYSKSTTESTYAALTELLSESTIKLKTIHDYHQDPAYIKALAQSIQKFWQQHGRAQKLILSYHGLPKAMINKGDPYEQQCKTSTKLLIQELNLSPNDYLMTFQSRLGPEPWLQPYTQSSLIDLAKQGIKHIQVICPGFACDCLETLEEINIENRRFFLDAGGQKFEYIPCLNDSAAQINLLTELINRNINE